MQHVKSFSFFLLHVRSLAGERTLICDLILRVICKVGSFTQMEGVVRKRNSLK